LLVMISPSIAPATETAERPETDRRFDVFLDNNKIGYHHWTFEGKPNDFTVLSQASYQVKVFYIPVYRYEHEARERWQSGCLTQLDSTTNEDGDKFRVDADYAQGELSTKTHAGEQQIRTSRIWSFAYWDADMLKRSQLLNAQDGQLEKVTIESLGKRSLTVDSKRVSVDAWRLRSDRLDMTLYYDQNKLWHGLDAALKNGRTLRYRPSVEDAAHPRNAGDN